MEAAIIDYTDSENSRAGHARIIRLRANVVILHEHYATLTLERPLVAGGGVLFERYPAIGSPLQILGNVSLGFQVYLLHFFDNCKLQIMSVFRLVDPLGHRLQ